MHQVGYHLLLLITHNALSSHVTLLCGAVVSAMY